MQYFSCGSDKYSEIKMCDLEPFSKIQSHIVIILKRYVKQLHNGMATYVQIDSYLEQQRN